MKFFGFLFLLNFMFFSLKAMEPVLFIYGPTVINFVQYKYDENKIRAIYNKLHAKIEDNNRSDENIYRFLMPKPIKNPETSNLSREESFLQNCSKNGGKSIAPIIMEKDDIYYEYRNNYINFTVELINDIKNIYEEVNKNENTQFKIQIVTVGLGAKVISDIFEEIKDYIGTVVAIDLVETMSQSQVYSDLKSGVVKKEFFALSYDEDDAIKYAENNKPELTPIKTNKLRFISESEESDSLNSTFESESFSSDTSKTKSNESYSSKSKNSENNGQKIIIEDQRVPMVLITLQDAEKFLKYTHKDDIECTCFGINWTKKKVDRTIALASLTLEIITAFA